jgi:hypothetical protein
LECRPWEPICLHSGSCCEGRTGVLQTRMDWPWLCVSKSSQETPSQSNIQKVWSRAHPSFCSGGQRLSKSDSSSQDVLCNFASSHHGYALMPRVSHHVLRTLESATLSNGYDPLAQNLTCAAATGLLVHMHDVRIQGSWTVVAARAASQVTDQRRGPRSCPTDAPRRGQQVSEHGVQRGRP